MEVFSQCKALIRKEAEYTWELGKEKTKQKLIHLAQKYQNKPPVSQEKFRGILISDTLINEKFGDKPPDMTPDCTDIPMSDQEKLALSLPPKFTTRQRIIRRDIQASAEVMCTKTRWDERSRREWIPL